MERDIFANLGKRVYELNLRLLEKNRDDWPLGGATTWKKIYENGYKRTQPLVF